MAYDVWFPYLNLKIKNLPRIAFRLFGLDIYFYGIIIALAIIFGMIVVVYKAKNSYQNEDEYINFIFWAIIFGIIGARIYYVLFSWDSYKFDLKKIFFIRQGGIAIYGAIIASILTAIFYCKKRNLDLKVFCDTCTYGLLTGQIIGRWGNFFNREAFGRETNNFFAMRYLASKVNFYDGIKPMIIDNFKYIQVHPTFLYESVWNLLILIFLIWYEERKKFDGEIFLLYLFFYAVGRFFIEGLRVDKLLLFSFPISQIVSVVIFILAGIILIKKHFFEGDKKIFKR